MTAIKKIVAWALARLNEPSTWAGLAAGAGAIGTALQSHAGLGAAVIAGVVAAVKSEKGAK